MDTSSPVVIVVVIILKRWITDVDGAEERRMSSGYG